MQTPPLSEEDDFLKYLIQPEDSEEETPHIEQDVHSKILSEGLAEVFEIAEHIAVELQEKRKELNECLLREHFARLLLKEGDRLISEALQHNNSRSKMSGQHLQKNVCDECTKKDLMQSIDQHRIEVSGWKLLLRHMLERYNEVTSENTGLRTFLESLEYEIQLLAEDNVVMEEHIKRLNDECEQLRADNYAMNSYIYEKETELERTEESLQEEKSERFMLQTLLDTRELEYIQLERRYAELEDKLKISSSSYQSLRDSIGSYDLHENENTE